MTAVDIEIVKETFKDIQKEVKDDINSLSGAQAPRTPHLQVSDCR